MQMGINITHGGGIMLKFDISTKRIARMFVCIYVRTDFANVVEIDCQCGTYMLHLPLGITEGLDALCLYDALF